MLTYELSRNSKTPLYGQLYEAIKNDILSSRIKAGERLPSKRGLSEHLKISKVTVENAYAQLVAEGYIRSEEKRGYFAEAAENAENVRIPLKKSPRISAEGHGSEKNVCDFSANFADPAAFPFSTWIRLMRGVVLDCEKELLRPLPHAGAPVLREAVADYLYRFRGLSVSPDCIVIGAGTEYLYSLLPQLLGRERIFAVEKPGYDKARFTYTSLGAKCVGIPLDENGVCPDILAESGASVLHISPSHHFPTGIVTPATRRRELFDWARAEHGRYIIEDDYDWEFRLTGRPIPPMAKTDGGERVVYINTFSKSLSPSIRISYMILPPQLMERYNTLLGFYSCTVPSFEQYTLAAFISGGYFEKHISRMKKLYRARRDAAVEAVKSSRAAEKFEILEKDAGLHFILKIDTDVPDKELSEMLLERGVKLKSLSDYGAEGGDTHSFIINYSSAAPEEISAGLDIIGTIAGKCPEKTRESRHIR